MSALLALCAPAARNALGAPSQRSQHLAAYRLTPSVFARWAHATRLIAAITRADTRFERDPLFTREISVLGDADEMATALEKRLDGDAALSGALFAADISAQEYASFAIALFAARLAQGFLKAGAMRRVPPGPAAENVAFVEAHEPQIAALLKQLNLE
jgi:hypothetical protein